LRGLTDQNSQSNQKPKKAPQQWGVFTSATVGTEMPVQQMAANFSIPSNGLS
jgi:hypothetical protein